MPPRSTRRCHHCGTCRPGLISEIFTFSLGISFPEEAIPDPLSLQSVARDQLAGDDEIGNRRRRWFSSAS